MVFWHPFCCHLRSQPTCCYSGPCSPICCHLGLVRPNCCRFPVQQALPSFIQSATVSTNFFINNGAVIISNQCNINTAPGDIVNERRQIEKERQEMAAKEDAMKKEIAMLKEQLSAQKIENQIINVGSTQRAIKKEKSFDDDEILELTKENNQLKKMLKDLNKKNSGFKIHGVKKN